MHDYTARARLFSRRQPGHTVLAVHGELDISTTTSLRDRFLTILKDTTTAAVIIDLSGVTFCDASGLALLIGAKRRARLHGLTVVLAAPRSNVAKLLRITGLDRAFTVHQTLSSARLGCAYADHTAAA